MTGGSATGVMPCGNIVKARLKIISQNSGEEGTQEGVESGGGGAPFGGGTQHNKGVRKKHMPAIWMARGLETHGEAQGAELGNVNVFGVPEGGGMDASPRS